MPCSCQVLAGEARPGRALRTDGPVPQRVIPSESTLMQEYGVARETARKAVRVLVAEGLVYVVQGRGAYVTG